MAQACYEIPWPPSKTTGVGKTLSRPQEEESWECQAFAVEGVPTSMPTSTPAWGFGWLLWVFLMGCIVTKQSGGAYRETEGWSLASAPWSWEQGIPGHSPGLLWYPMAQAGAGITYSTAGIPGTHLIRSFSTTLSYCTKALIRTLSTLLFTLGAGTAVKQQLQTSNIREGLPGANREWNFPYVLWESLWKAAATPQPFVVLTTVSSRGKTLKLPRGGQNPPCSWTFDLS